MLNLIERFPVIDILLLFIVMRAMHGAWRNARLPFIESNLARRQLGANTITNQVNGSVTVISIILAGVGAILTIGYDKGLPPPTFLHLGYTALWGFLAISLGIYTLGYISSPTVIDTIDVSKKEAVQLIALAQLILIFLAIARFAASLVYLLRVPPAAR